MWQQMGAQTTDEQDYAIGIKALQYFNDASSGYTGYNFTMDDLIKSMGITPSGWNQNTIVIHIQGVGLAANANEMTDTQIKEAMEDLAFRAQGSVPKDFNGFINAINNYLTNPSNLDLIEFETVELAKSFWRGTVGDIETASEIVQAVGSGVVSVGSAVVSGFKYLPYILLGVAAVAGIVILNKAKRVIS